MQFLRCMRLLLLGMYRIKLSQLSIFNHSASFPPSLTNDLITSFSSQPTNQPPAPPRPPGSTPICTTQNDNDPVEEGYNTYVVDYLYLINQA